MTTTSYKTYKDLTTEERKITHQNFINKMNTGEEEFSADFLDFDYYNTEMEFDNFYFNSVTLEFEG